MPDFLTVFGDIRCPRCGSGIDTSVDIQWGKVPNKRNIGEEVKWLQVRGELVAPFTLLEGQSSWNCGDPTLDKVFAFDCNHYALDLEERPHCVPCGMEIGGVMVVIESNVIKQIRVCTSEEIQHLFGDKQSKADIIVVEKDGSLNVKEDWFDHVVKYVKV